MPLSSIPHPPNAAWMPPLDPNDQQALEQEELVIEQQFKTILSQDMANSMGNIELREQEQQQEEDEEGDQIQEYGDQIQIPGDEEI